MLSWEVMSICARDVFPRPECKTLPPVRESQKSSFTKDARKQKALLMGYYGVGNLGDEMMQVCLKEWLEQQGFQLTVLSENPAAVSKSSGLRAIENAPLLGEWSWRRELAPGPGLGSLARVGRKRCPGRGRGRPDSRSVGMADILLHHGETDCGHPAGEKGVPCECGHRQAIDPVRAHPLEVGAAELSADHRSRCAVRKCVPGTWRHATGLPGTRHRTGIARSACPTETGKHAHPPRESLRSGLSAA